VNTKTTTIRAIDIFQGLGNDRDGIPFRWLTSLVEKVRAVVPDDEEDTCKVYGAAGLAFRYEHRLTEQEVLAEKIAALEAKLQAVRGLLPASGPVSIDGERLREILG